MRSTRGNALLFGASPSGSFLMRFAQWPHLSLARRVRLLRVVMFRSPGGRTRRAFMDRKVLREVADAPRGVFYEPHAALFPPIGEGSGCDSEFQGFFSSGEEIG